MNRNLTLIIAVIIIVGAILYLQKITQQETGEDINSEISVEDAAKNDIVKELSADEIERNEKIIEVALPLIISMLLFCLQYLGKKYYVQILSISLAIIIIVSLIYFSFRFLDRREKRWEGNKKKHIIFEKEIKDIKNTIKNITRNIEILKRDLNIYGKINKLENDIKIIKGKKDGK